MTSRIVTGRRAYATAARGVNKGGALITLMYDRKTFDPASLDGLIAMLGQIYQAAAGAPPR